MYRILPRLVCLGLVGLCANNNVMAMRWQLQPAVGLSEYFSDNVSLAEKGQEITAFVTAVNPAVTLNGTGSSSQMRGSYAMQNYFYHTDGESLNDVRYHNGAIAGSLKALQNRFNLNLGTTYSQQTIDPHETRRKQEFNQTNGEKANDFYSFRFEPEYRHEFGQLFAQASYSFEHIDFRDDDFFQTRNFASAVIGTRGKDRKFQSRLTYRYDNRELLQGEFTIQNVESNSSYLFSPRFTGSASVGYDNNEVATLEDDEGVVWGMGIEWRPINRITLQANLGQRFYGETYTFRYFHRLRRFDWNLSYRRELARFRSEGLEQQILGPDPNNNNNNNNPVQPIGIVDSNNQTELQISNRADLGLTLNARRNRFYVSAYSDFRDYVNDNRKTDQDQYMGAAVQWRYSFSQRASLAIHNNFERNREVRAEAGADRDITYFRTTVSFDRRIGNRMSFNTAWVRTEGKEENGIDYVENVGLVQFRMQF